MVDLSSWKLAVDLLLMVSICALCARLMKGGMGASRNPRAQELEGSLRSLIREADDVGRTLNDELQRRQRDLNRLLQDLQSAESQARRAMHGARDQGAEEQLAARQSRPVQPRSTLSDQVERSVEPPSFRSTPVAQEREPQRAASSKAARVNIFGEPIGEAVPTPQPSAPQAPTPRRAAPQASAYRQPIAEPTRPAPAQRHVAQPPKPLAAEIEQSVTPEPLAEVATDIYRAAEELLRAGKEIAFVAATTKLPVDEVKVLSRVVSQQIIAKSSVGIVAERVLAPETPHVRTADPRLGVLNTMRRQVQTL